MTPVDTTVPLDVYYQAVSARAQLRAAYAEAIAQLGELCDAAQAVLDGRAREVDSAGDRYVMDRTLQQLEAVLRKIRKGV